MDFNELENSFDFDDEDFDIDIQDTNPSESRYVKPKKQRKKPYRLLKFKNAQNLAEEINFQSLDRAFVIVDGSFIFGDFIESFLVRNQVNAIEMTISTLSLSQDNVISLKKLIEANYIQKLNLIISDYFYSHERNKLVKYIYELLDVDDKFQLAVCRTHCKITQFKTEGGKHIVIHGSANLRSSDNLEQFVIEDNKEIYDFNQEYNNEILKRYKTINKSIKTNELWQVVANNTHL